MFISKVSQTCQKGLFLFRFRNWVAEGLWRWTQWGRVCLSKSQTFNCSPWLNDSYGCSGDVHDTLLSKVYSKLGYWYWSPLTKHFNLLWGISPQICTVCYSVTWKLWFWFLEGGANLLELWLDNVQTITNNMLGHLPGFPIHSQRAI